MMTLTIDVPDTLSQQFQKQQISEQKIKAVALAALEIWLAQDAAEKKKRFTGSAKPYVQRLIAQNRELFETLARR